MWILIIAFVIVALGSFLFGDIIDMIGWDIGSRRK